MTINSNSLCQRGRDMNSAYSEKTLIIERARDKLYKIIQRKDIFCDTEMYEELFELKCILLGLTNETIEKIKRGD
jgi:hypothetical protein